MNVFNSIDLNYSVLSDLIQMLHGFASSNCTYSFGKLLQTWLTGCTTLALTAKGIVLEDNPEVCTEAMEKQLEAVTHHSFTYLQIIV